MSTSQQAERVRRVQELRRSSASTRHRSKKTYSRTRKHAGKGWS